MTPLDDCANILNNSIRDAGYILATSSEDRANILNKQLVANDVVVTCLDDKIWCTSSYIQAGNKYFNLQVVNDVTLPTPISGTINDSTTMYNRSLCFYFNATYGRINFRKSAMGTWINYIYDGTAGNHYVLNLSQSSPDIFNTASPNCLNYAFIYINGWQWPLQYFLFDGTYKNIQNICKFDGNVATTYNFNMTAVNQVTSHRFLGRNGLSTSSITSVTLHSKEAILDRLNLYENAFNINTDTLTSVLHFYNMFTNFTALPNINTDAVTVFSHMFNGCSNLRAVPNFNTVLAQNLAYTFFNCTNLVTVPNFHLNNATVLTAMFYNCYNILYIPNFNTAKVINMSEVFAGCRNLTELPMLNTTLVTNMSFLCANCYNLSNIWLYDTGNVTSMLNMFSNCTNLVNVPQFNTAKVTIMGNMFRWCNNLSNASVQNVINMVLNSNITSTSYKNLSNINSYSPFYNTKFDSSYYSNRLTELQIAGWNY